jgi:hypothetical protein
MVREEKGVVLTTYNGQISMGTAHVAEVKDGEWNSLELRRQVEGLGQTSTLHTAVQTSRLKDRLDSRST